MIQHNSRPSGMKVKEHRISAVWHPSFCIQEDRKMYSPDRNNACFTPGAFAGVFIAQTSNSLLKWPCFAKSTIYLKVGPRVRISRQTLCWSSHCPHEEPVFLKSRKSKTASPQSGKENQSRCLLRIAMYPENVTIIPFLSVHVYTSKVIKHQ